MLKSLRHLPMKMYKLSPSLRFFGLGQISLKSRVDGSSETFTLRQLGNSDMAQIVPLVSNAFDDLDLFKLVKERTGFTDKDNQAMFHHLLQQSIDHQLAFGGFLKSGELVAVMCNTNCDKFEIDYSKIPE